MPFHVDFDKNKTLAGTGHGVNLTIAQEIAFGELCRRIGAETQAEALRYMAQVAFECLGLLPRTSVTESVAPEILSALDLRQGDALDADPFTDASTTDG